jgi:DNA repair protein RecN (Recombination protein N)
MLRFLSIKRLAIIDSIDVEFQPGLNVLTGETGAGKSILIEAVGLLLGGRASGDLVRSGEESAAIEAIFEVAGEETLVRRELTAQGRSRAFINGDLATAAALKDLAARLVELHGQHEHQTLLDSSTHLGVLDTIGDHGESLERVAAAFTHLQRVRDDLDRMRRTAADRSARHEFLQFQIAELDRAALKPVSGEEPGEDIELARLRQVLSNAERVRTLCTEAHALLYERDDAALASLSGAWRRVAELSAIDSRFQPYLDAREAIKSQLEDLAMFLQRYGESVEASPARLQQVDDRLALLDRLKRKHGPTLADVMARRAALGRELAELDETDTRLDALEREAAEAREAYVDAAGALSVSRRRVARDFIPAFIALLQELAMGETRFEVRFADTPAESGWGPAGFDDAEFFLSTNPGEDLRPLARIVSGGELSRVMLAIKTLVATSRFGFTESDERPPSGAAPGLIFDEVDAGIGGRVADVVGQRLRALGSAFQVLCITHLPQIAACADAHFLIEKRVVSGRTHTIVTRLDRDGRIAEIGRMLGGVSVTPGLLASAREMLDARGAKGEDKSKGESERAKAKPARVKDNRTTKARGAQIPD